MNRNNINTILFNFWRCTPKIQVPSCFFLFCSNLYGEGFQNIRRHIFDQKVKSIFGEDLATFQIPSCSNKNQHGICFKRLLNLHMASFQSKCNVHFLFKQKRFETSVRRPQTSISLCDQNYAIWYFESPLHTILMTKKGNKKGSEISVHILKTMFSFFRKSMDPENFAVISKKFWNAFQEIAPHPY